MMDHLIAAAGPGLPEITDPDDLADAIKDFPNTPDAKKPRLKRHLIQVAKAVQREDLLPDEWIGGD